MFSQLVSSAAKVSPLILISICLMLLLNWRIYFRMLFIWGLIDLRWVYHIFPRAKKVYIEYFVFLILSVWYLNYCFVSCLRCRTWLSAVELDVICPYLLAWSVICTIHGITLPVLGLLKTSTIPLKHVTYTFIAPCASTIKCWTFNRLANKTPLQTPLMKSSTHPHPPLEQSLIQSIKRVHFIFVSSITERQTEVSIQQLNSQPRFLSWGAVEYAQDKDALPMISDNPLVLLFKFDGVLVRNQEEHFTVEKVVLSFIKWTRKK